VTRSTAGRVGQKAVDLGLPLLTIGLCVLAWELYIRIDDVPLYVLAPPGDSFEAAWTNAGPLSHDALVTLKEMVAGYVLASVIGLLIALLIDASELLERLLYPFLVGSQVVPLIVIAPVLVLLLGYGFTPKLVIVTMICTFVIVLESLVGLRSLELEKVYLARSIGASRLRFFLQIKIPNALPHIMGGLKLAATLSVIGAVVGEFIAADEGLGHYVLVANANQNTVAMLSGIIWLAGLGIIVFFVMDILERLAIPWHVSRRLESTGGRTM
jgi:NitT/TauT family transport system permease protein